MTQSTSSLIYNFVRDLPIGEEFTAYQLYQLAESDGATHGAICGILHRLVRAGMLTIIRKDRSEKNRPCYVFSMVNPSIVIPVKNIKQNNRSQTRHDTVRHALFIESYKGKP